EIDFRRVRMAVVRADLARLPAGDGHVAAGDLAEDFLHVALGIPLLLALETEDVHRSSPPTVARMKRSEMRESRIALRSIRATTTTSRRPARLAALRRGAGACPGWSRPAARRARRSRARRSRG